MPASKAGIFVFIKFIYTFTVPFLILSFAKCGSKTEIMLHKYCKKLQVPESLIKDMSNDMRTLAFFLSVHALYQNSIVYDYKAEKLASDLSNGVTPGQVRLYIRKLKKLGWVQVQNKTRYSKNLRFISVKKIANGRYNETHKSTVKIEIRATLRDIIDRMYLKLIEQIGRRHLYLDSKREEESNMKLKPQRRSSGRSGGDENSEFWNLLYTRDDGKQVKEDYGHLFLTGYRTLSKWLNISASTTYQLVKRLRSKGLLTTETISRRLGKISYKQYLRFFKDKSKFFGYTYYHKGVMYNCLGTSFKLKEYPLKYNLE